MPKINIYKQPINTLTKQQLSECEKLILKHEKQVLAYLKNFFICKKKTEDFAEDALQDSKIKIYKNFYKYDSSQNFKNWFFKIAVNCAIDILNKEEHSAAKYSIDMLKETNVNYEYMLPVVSDNIDEKMIINEQFKKAMKVADKLPEPLRQTLIDIEYNEFSYKELSKKTNINIPALRLRIYRAKKKAKEIASKNK